MSLSPSPTTYNSIATQHYLSMVMYLIYSFIILSFIYQKIYLMCHSYATNFMLFFSCMQLSNFQCSISGQSNTHVCITTEVTFQYQPAEIRQFEIFTKPYFSVFAHIYLLRCYCRYQGTKLSIVYLVSLFICCHKMQNQRSGLMKTSGVPVAQTDSRNCKRNQPVNQIVIMRKHFDIWGPLECSVFMH